MNKTLNDVFWGILAQEEFLKDNSTLDGIKSYAENGMNKYITDEQAQKIKRCISFYHSRTFWDANSIFWEIDSKLADEEI